MQPVICFGPNNKYVLSTNYQLICCQQNEDINLFLEKIQNNFFNKLKIIQINFSAYHEKQFANQKKIIDAPKAHVFILNEYIEMPELPINTDINHEQLQFKSQLSEYEFKQKIEQIKRAIGAGRLYQVNLTSHLTCDLTHASTLRNTQNHTAVSGLDWFLSFAQFFSGEYKAFLPLEDYEILCYSPELFLEKKQSQLRTCPIKGSVKKSANLANDLIQNEKESAELSMIVDLLRNDFNSLSLKHSAKVVKHRALLELNYIRHTYSEIIIETHENLPFVLSKVFPGGSISGCPKLESLNLISEIEPYNRSFYTGSIGWWKESDFALNLTIRSFAKYKKQLFYFAGCGIVYDSVADMEWAEFLTKTGYLNVVNS